MRNSFAYWFADGADTRKLNRLVLAVLVMFPLVIFGPSLNYEFVGWDDDTNITANPHVSGLGWGNLKWMLTDVRLAHRYMPLGWFCYAVERTVWGDNPFIFHLGNLALHTINGLLLFGLLKRILSQFKANEGKISVRVIAASGMGALLWCLHPLRTEVVSWCASRIYLMATLWFMLSVLSYLRSVTGSKHSTRWLGASAGFFTASLLTYPILLLGAVTFVCLDMFVLHRLPISMAQWLNPTWKRAWFEKLPFFLIGTVCLGLTVATRTVGEQRGYLETLEFFNLPHRVAQGFYGWAYYTWITWWPFNLAPRYGTLLSFNPTDAKFLVSLALVLSLTSLSLWFSRRWPVVLGLWLCHVILYLPFIGLTEHPHSTYDRYTYAPGMLWAVVAAAILWKIWPNLRRRYASFAFCGMLGCGLIGLSSQQTLVWQNTATVRLRVAESYGLNPARSLHEEVAGLYFRSQNMLEPARDCFLRALRLRPDDVESRIYLGDTLAAMGQEAKALAEYNKAAQANPPDLKTRHNLGVAYCKLGRYREGAAIFADLLRDDPDHANARHNLSLALQKMAGNKQADPNSTQASGLPR